VLACLYQKPLLGDIKVSAVAKGLIITDTMPFISTKFKADLTAKEQSLSLSGIGAHHQNGVDEGALQTVTQWARAMLLHQVLHWPDQAQLDLWPFAMEHAVYLWNHSPKKDCLLAPVELFTGAVFDDYTGHVSLQYHVVYDDLFSTVPNAKSGGVDDQMPFNPIPWNQIVNTGHEHTIDPAEEASTGT
jgi:hypothetical protein